MPLLATCVLIFHLKLISVQRIMQMRAAHIAGQVYLIHGDETGDIADDSQRIWYETFFAVSQFMNTPTVYFLEQVDGEHRHQNGETVDYAQYYQFVLDGHDTKISEEKK